MRYTSGVNTTNTDLSPADENGPLRIMTERQFTDLLTFTSPANDLWKRVVYIQTAIKSRMGLGYTYTVNYVSERTPEAVAKLRKAGLQSNVGGEWSTMQQNPLDY
jgi:hypothetical protein